MCTVETVLYIGSVHGNVNSYIHKCTHIFLSVFVKTKFHQLNGVNVQGEAIADNGGMKLAYRVYKNSKGLPEPSLPGLQHFTTDQMFFLGFANLWWVHTIYNLTIRCNPFLHLKAFLFYLVDERNCRWIIAYISHMVVIISLWLYVSRGRSMDGYRRKSGQNPPSGVSNGCGQWSRIWVVNVKAQGYIYVQFTLFNNWKLFLTLYIFFIHIECKLIWYEWKALMIVFCEMLNTRHDE